MYKGAIQIKRLIIIITTTNEDNEMKPVTAKEKK